MRGTGQLAHSAWPGGIEEFRGDWEHFHHPPPLFVVQMIPLRLADMATVAASISWCRLLFFFSTRGSSAYIRTLASTHTRMVAIRLQATSRSISIDHGTSSPGHRYTIYYRQPVFATDTRILFCINCISFSAPFFLFSLWFWDLALAFVSRSWFHFNRYPPALLSSYFSGLVSLGTGPYPVALTANIEHCPGVSVIVCVCVCVLFGAREEIVVPAA